MQEKILEDEDAVRDVCASHSNQVLALNCKGEALAIIKALIAGEYETTRGSIETIVDPMRNESWDWMSFSTSTLSENVRDFKVRYCGEKWHSGVREVGLPDGKFRLKCQTIVKFPSSAV